MKKITFLLISAFLILFCNTLFSQNFYANKISKKDIYSGGSTDTNTSLNNLNGDRKDIVYISEFSSNKPPLKLDKSKVLAVNFDYSDLRNLNFSKCTMWGNFDYTNLSKVSFKGSHLDWADFKGAYIDKSNFKKATGEVHFFNSTGSPRLYKCMFSVVKCNSSFLDRLNGKHRKWFVNNYSYKGVEPVYKKGVKIDSIHVWVANSHSGLYQLKDENYNEEEI